MIDNFEIIKPLFYFNEGNDMFFHCQILRRGKDHPELPAANKLIQSWLVRSREQLDKLKDEIVFLCEHYKARAYINLTLVEESDFDADKLRQYFDPQHFFVKLSPINPNEVSDGNNLGKGIIEGVNLV